MTDNRINIGLTLYLTNQGREMNSNSAKFIVLSKFIKLITIVYSRCATYRMAAINQILHRLQNVITQNS